MKGTAGMDSDGPSSAGEQTEGEEDAVVPLTRLSRHGLHIYCVQQLLEGAIAIFAQSAGGTSRYYPPPHFRRISALSVWTGEYESGGGRTSSYTCLWSLFIPLVSLFPNVVALWLS